MAYVSDPKSLRFVDFQRVPMVNDRMRGLSGLGTDGTLPSTLMSICDVQKHLVAAGKLPRSGVDGAWGQQSHRALDSFIYTYMPTGASHQVIGPDYLAHMPAVGVRDDYRLMAGGKIRIPALVATAFPAKANVACSSGRPSTPPTPSTPPAPGTPAQDDPGSSNGGGDASGPPWAVIGVVAAVAVLGTVLLVTRKKKEGSA